ncbi:MAG: hypothetical protein ACREGJ_01140 [Candidatus Saccharimonadales bacterium]
MALQQLEEKLNEFFVTKAPFQLPENGKKVLVQLLPWLTLIGGVLSLFAVWGLYQLATWANSVSMWANELNRAYGTYGYPTTAAAVGPVVWLSLALMLVVAVLYFVAFPALRARKKSGWNILLWVALLYVAVAIVNLFMDQQIVSFLFSLLGSVVGLYLLFQVRSHYSAVPTQTGKKTGGDTTTHADTNTSDTASPADTGSSND